jgi:hypothetical protein
MKWIGLCLVVLSGCVGAGGAGARQASAPGDHDAHVQADCVLLSEGAICSFTAKDRPGSRCVKVLYAVVSGTVVSSDTVCSGRLAANESSTLVVRFSTRPGDACGSTMGDCLVKTVEPAAAIDAAAAWQAEIKQNYNGPVTEAECKKLHEHRYDIWMHADCDGIPDPAERNRCYQNITAERDRELQYFQQDCLRYTRDLLKCELAAKTAEDIYQCEDRFYR